MSAHTFIGLGYVASIKLLISLWKYFCLLMCPTRSFVSNKTREVHGAHTGSLLIDVTRCNGAVLWYLLTPARGHLEEMSNVLL